MINHELANKSASNHWPVSTKAIALAIRHIVGASSGLIISHAPMPTLWETKSTYFCVAFSDGGAHTLISLARVFRHGREPPNPVIWFRISLKAARMPYCIVLNWTKHGSVCTSRMPCHLAPLRMFRGLQFLIPLASITYFRIWRFYFVTFRRISNSNFVISSNLGW